MTDYAPQNAGSLYVSGGVNSLSIFGCNIKGQAQGGSGGGIYLTGQNGDVIISDSIFSGCTALTSGGKIPIVDQEIFLEISEEIRILF